MDKTTDTKQKNKYNNLKRKIKTLITPKDRIYLNTLIEDKHGKANLDKRKKDRIIVLLRILEDCTYKNISDETGLSKRTIIYYLYDFMDCKTIGAYIHKQNNHRKSSLDKIIKVDEIKKIFEETKPKSNKDAMKIINATYCINISESTARRFLIRNNIHIKLKR